jgi:predicted transcriptional regulator
MITVFNVNISINYTTFYVIGGRVGSVTYADNQRPIKINCEILFLNYILCFQIAKKKETFRQQIEDFLDREKEFKETKKHKEEIEKKLIEIYRRSKQKIEKMQKEKEQQVSNYTFICSFLMI